MGNRVNHIQGSLKTQPEISNEDIIRFYIGMICLGGSVKNDMKNYEKGKKRN